MRTVRVSDLVFNGIRKVADREGISMASVIDRMLTYSCKVCDQPLFPAGEEEFRAFSAAKKKEFTEWGHTKCLESLEKE